MELMFGVVVAIATAILSAVFWPMFGSKIQHPICHMLRKGDSEDTIQAVFNFYIDRVDHSERIAPDFLRHFLDSENHSVRSMSDLKRHCAVAQYPIHILLYVTQAKKVIGVCKLMYLCKISSFFIAYYAARPNTNASSTDILDVIIKYITPCIGSDLNIYYEISPNIKKHNTQVAKERLFGHYARSRNFFVKTLLVNYLQPEIWPSKMEPRKTTACLNQQSFT